MLIKDKIVVVTGAASGIGVALARRFHAEGAKLVVCSDINGDGARVTAEAVGGVAFTTDVSKEADIQHLVENTSNAITDLSICSAPTPVSGSAAGRRRRTMAGREAGTSTSWPMSGPRGTSCR